VILLSEHWSPNRSDENFLMQKKTQKE
jgi:hypothetical protein